MVENYSIAITTAAKEAAKIASKEAAAGTMHHQTSGTLPIYLIDSSLSHINHTKIAVATWGDIAPYWNRTAEYSNLMNLATTVSALPIDNSDSDSKRRQIVLLHVGPKLGSSTLRSACHKGMQRTCPQINTTGREIRSNAPPGYFGGDRLVSVIKECVDTNYFCVYQIPVLDMDMLPAFNTTTITSANETAIISKEQQQQQQQQQQTNNIQYIHLFPFRNYNDWVLSAIKQQYDRGGLNGCIVLQRKWEDGKCQHNEMEIDIRKYARVNLDRFLGGVIGRMNSSSSGRNVDDNKLEEAGGGEEHTFILYLHRDLHQAMKVLSTAYHIPMLPGTTSEKKGKRPEGTCNESLVELYHECFSNGLMEFRWDLPENQVPKPKE